MSIIYSYPEETSLQGSDMLIGTSTALVGGKQKNITKNFTLDQLSSFIQGGEGVINPAASDFQIAVFNESGAKLTGSIMSQDVYPNGTGITVSGNLSTTGNLVAPGTVTLGSGSNLIDLTSTTKFSGIAQDANGTQGTLNQILLSDTNGRLVWGNYTAGLTYQGLWNASTNSPGLSSSFGVNSTFYIVGTAGNTVLDGNTDWQVGDWAIFVGTTGAGGIWQKIDNTSSITGNGTVNRMVMWSSNFTVTDGPLLDSSGTNVLSILDRSIIPSVSNTRSLGSSSLKWNMLYVNDIETTNINILSHVDLNSLPGTPGQVLTSSGVGAPAVWTTPTTGTITGAGTTNKIPLWTNNVAIGDSILTQLNAATPFTDTYLSVGSGGVSTTGLKVDGFFVDSTGSKGTAGQILSSTGTATLWKTGEDSSVTYTLAAGAQDGSSVPINLTDSLAVTTPVKITGGTNVNVVRTSDTEITLNSTDTNTTYDFGSSTSGSDVLLNLVGTPADNSSVKLIGSGVTIAQTNDEVTFTVPAGDTYDLNAGVKSGTSVPLNLTSGSGADNSVVNLTEGTGITLTQTSATEITIAGVAQGVTGSGTVNKLPKFDTTSSLTDSLVSETNSLAFDVTGTLVSSTATVLTFTDTTNNPTNITVGGTLTVDSTPVGGPGVVVLNVTNVNNQVITATGTNAGVVRNALDGSYSNIPTAYNSGVSSISIAGILNMSTNKITNVINPTDNQDAATKAYVDNVVSGQLIFEGSYDATTAPPFGPNILQGFTYVVNVAGDYGGLWPIPLAVGDLIISNQDNPVDVGDYTEVNKQVDVATDTVLGVANFPTGNNGLNVSSGAVTAKLFTGTTPGYVPDATSAPTGTFLKEDGTWAVAGVGSVTNFSTVSTAYPGITTTVTNPTSTPELVLGLGTNAAAGKYLDGGTGDWVTLPESGVTSVDGGTPFNSTGLPLSISPTSGAVTISSAIYNGGFNIGVVPDGGTSTTFLKGDGSWSLPGIVGITQGTTYTSTGNPLDISTLTGSTSISLGVYNGGSNIGIVPDSGTSTTFLRGDGQWATPTAASATITTQNAVGDGTNLTFALGATPNGGSSSFVDVFIDGVYQEISTYSISGTNLVFSAGNAPPAGTNVETKTTADYNVGAAVQTVNGLTGNVSTKDVPVVKTNSTPEAVTTQNQHLYVLYGSAAVTLTLPSSPAAGDYIKISNLSTLTTNVVAQAASGERIMGTAADLTLDNATASFQLIYSGVSDPGWVVVGPA